MLRAAVIVLLFALLPSHLRAETRIALLIGNEAYASGIGRLGNPHNDILLLEQALKGLGFEVVTVRDAGLGTLYQAVNAYARRLQAAGPTAVGFFYYSGHGASDGSTNYLIPVDVKTIEAGELWDQSLRLTEITRRLKAEAGNATHFVVFDACRNTLKLTNPGSRALVQSKGFVPVAQENGMLIAYATAEGELASDAGAGAGPYAKVLADEIVKPGIEAVVMFRAVQRRVRATIKQEPYLGFNALGDVYLAGRSEQPAQPKQQTDYSRTEVAQFCQSVATNPSIAVLQSLLDAYKGTLLAGCVHARLEELKKQLVATAPPHATPQPLKNEQTASTNERVQTETKREDATKLEAWPRDAWDAIKGSTSVSALEAFIARYPYSSYADLARQRISELKIQKTPPQELEKEAKTKERARAETKREDATKLEAWPKGRMGRYQRLHKRFGARSVRRTLSEQLL